MHHLIAVTASANRKKGARGPEEWKPANRGYWCDYAIDWVQIKADWDLSVTNAEWEAVQEMLGTCDTKPSVNGGVIICHRGGRAAVVAAV